MLRLKREKTGLIFELKPPFNNTFFSELKSTIHDFIKIGKKSFCYDFKFVEMLEPQIAKKFEALIPDFQQCKCSLRILNASNNIIQALPSLVAIAKSSGRSESGNTHFAMDFTINNKSKEAIVRLSGEFMEQDALDKFKSTLSQVMKKSRSIILDCSKLEYISTIAVGGFIFLKVSCDREKKKVVFCQISSSIKSTLEMSGILHIIPLADTIDQARASLQKSSQTS
jgi:anti-sigma B factor antagonist